MSDKRIIYPNGAGGVSVIVPAPGCDLTPEQIAAKDVPPNLDGTPREYQIVDVADIPEDRTFRNAWEYE